MLRGKIQRMRKMVSNNRASSSSSHFKSAKYILPRKSSTRSITLYIFMLFALSILIFIYYTKDILKDEQQQQQQHTFPFNQMSNEHIREAHFTNGLHPCIKPTVKYKAAQGGDRYITVRSNGGLNQMRTGISDMVAIAHIMNATLVIPQLDKRSFWQDKSTFSDVFDELHFIRSLHGDVSVVKQLPKELEFLPHARKHFTSWSGMGYYEEMTHVWKDYKVVHVPKSDSRLANNDLPLDIQRLRCRALYHALRFIPPIENLGKKLVERLRLRAGGYIALHLRYEKDMLSFTGCDYGLTHTESEELRVMRENTNHWKIKNINSTEQRIGGFCPLTPKEVGIFLQGLGYPSSTLIYVAAGEIYGGSTHLTELTSRFPNVVFKESIATQEELKEFSNHASQTAALDYIISVESDIFVPSYSGNMARSVEGHRRFLGHRTTITPDRKGLVDIFDKLESGLITDSSSLSHLVIELHRNRHGAPRRRSGAPLGIKGRARFRFEESFYQNPYPECICGSRRSETERVGRFGFEESLEQIRSQF